MSEGVKVDQRWRHKGNGNVYRIAALPKVRHPGSGDWLPGVLYERADALLPEPYVRTLADFLDRFEGAE